jgi:hypothetical protein
LPYEAYILLIKSIVKQPSEYRFGYDKSTTSGADSLHAVRALVDLTAEVASVAVFAHPVPAILNTYPLSIFKILLVTRFTEARVGLLLMPQLQVE